MFMGFDGWFVIIFAYALFAAVVFGLIYAAVRLAVFHALRSHTRWIDRGKR